MARPYVHNEEAARKEAERIRLEETERRMTTGEPHPVQERLKQLIASYAEPMTEKELQKLIDETELKMTGMWPPPNVDDYKVAPESAVIQKPSEKAIRTFILTHGRAPSERELWNLR